MINPAEEAADRAEAKRDASRLKMRALKMRAMGNLAMAAAYCRAAAELEDNEFERRGLRSQAAIWDLVGFAELHKELEPYIQEAREQMAKELLEG